MMNQFNDKNFEEEVIKSNIPVIVDYYADWCAPCKMMAPVVAQEALEYADRIKFGKINIDENNQTAMKYRILSIPTLLFFENGKIVGKIEGAVTKSVVDEKIKKYFNI